LNKPTQTIKGALSESKVLAHVREKLAGGDVRSRTDLATELCKEFEFVNARGEPQVASCLKALRDFERAGEFELPARVLDINTVWSPRRLADAVPAPEGVPESVDRIQGLEVQLVSPKDDTAMRTWNELICREHPWGAGRLVGRQLRYLIRSEHGYLGAIGFAACALSLAAREKWIGWDADQHHANHHRLLNLSRLLIRPNVRCHNLASRAVGLCVRRLAHDFEDRYGFEPWLLETFVDTERHEGTCFRAANWQRIGRTMGRGRNDRERRSEASIKDIYVYPLVPDFRERMGVDASQGLYLRPIPIEHGLEEDEWIKQEFGTVELGDKRLRDRLMQIVADRSNHPNTSYLEACDGNRAASKGFYAFVDSVRDTVNPEAIIATHRERTIGRMMNEKLVLVVQDTTDLNFSSRPKTEGLGPIGSNQTGAVSLGLRMHSSLAVTTEGMPLGVLKSNADAPPQNEQAIPTDAPIEEKKSFKWIDHFRDCVEISKQLPNTRLLGVMDREADIFELFAEAEPTRKRVGLLVRAMHNRSLEGGELKLFEEMRGIKEATAVEVAIPRQRQKKAKSGKPGNEGKPARTATLSIAFKKVSIRPTRKDLESMGPLSLCAIYAREDNPPEGSKPIQWMLLTTEEVETIGDAVRMIELYGLRWRIEEWHRILKSGCKVQEHQHETADRLKRVIAIDTVLAWRIQLMTLIGRQVPGLPAEVFFDVGELEVLTALAEEQNNGSIAQPLTLGDAIVTMARMGGYLARPSDPPPGAKVLWRGLIRLRGMVDGFRLAMRFGRRS